VIWYPSCGSALDQLPFDSAAVPLAKVIHPFLMIRLSGGHHVIEDDQDAVPDCHRRAFGSPPFAQASILLSQIGLCPSGGMPCLNQCCLHIRMSGACSSALALACALFVARKDCKYAHEMKQNLHNSCAEGAISKTHQFEALIMG
jgi:hypothetical protein